VYWSSLQLLISLLLGAISDTLLRRRISQPLPELTDLMRKVTQEQDYGVRAEVRGGDEVAQLGHGFNTMLAEIQRRDSDLQQKKLELEEELKRRQEVNRELAQAKEQAEFANRSKSEFLANDGGADFGRERARPGQRVPRDGAAATRAAAERGDTGVPERRDRTSCR
jgi:methyl-accepting chemotaxis protein